MFYIFFNSIQSVVIGLRKADYERLSAMKCCLVCKEFRLQSLGHAVASLTKGPTLLTVILQREDLAVLRLFS